MVKIGMVIVTYNRLNELKTTLKSIENQEVVPSYVLIVDNASNNEEYLFLEEWKEKKGNFKKFVIHNKINLGGSGGFYTGLDASMKLDADWIWVSDDDAFPEANALREATTFMESNKNQLDDISAICSTVINNGKIDIYHRRTMQKNFFSVISKPVDINEYNKEYFYLNLFSYVGVIINKEKLSKVGVTEKDYFIRFDDTEHSLRLNDVGRIICIPKMRVHHNVDEEANAINWKVYYGTRNEAVTIRKHFSKKYFLEFCFSKLIKKFIRGIINKDFMEFKITCVAINDAFKDRMGTHQIYRPGWKYNDKK